MQFDFALKYFEGLLLLCSNSSQSYGHLLKDTCCFGQVGFLENACLSKALAAGPVRYATIDAIGALRRAASFKWRNRAPKLDHIRET